MPDYLLVIVLGVIAIGAVLFPLIAGRDRYASNAELDADVDRYRTALREGTLCDQCREASPAGSRFCQRCGAALC